MDAAYTYFKKTALFLATVLLIAAPGRAQTFNLNGTGSSAVSTQALVVSQAVTVGVASSDGTTAIAFTTATQYTGANQTGSNWLSVTSDGLTTPTNLFLSLANTTAMSPNQTYTATLTLTSTNRTPAITATIPVSFTFGSGTGAILANPSSVSLVGVSKGTASQMVGLSAANGSAITFNVSSATIPAGGTWLTAGLTSGYSNTTPSNLTITGNAANLTDGTYYGTVTVSGGGGSTQISVQFTAGSSGVSGNLTANPASWTWYYTTGTFSYPASQQVTLTSSTGATQYSDIVSTTSTSVSWLYANGATSSYSLNISSGVGVSANANIDSLTTGTYYGYVDVTDSNSNRVRITVTLVVNGGSTTGINWTPNPVNISTSVSGSTQQVQVNLTSATAGTFTASITYNPYLALYVSAVATSTTAPAAGYLYVYGSPGGLQSGTYPGTLSVTLTPVSGSPITQQIPINLIVGSGGGTTPSGGVTPTSLTFAYETGIAVTQQSLPAQSIVVSGTGSFTVGTPTYTSGQPTGWISVTPASGIVPGTLVVSVDPTGLTASATPYTGAVVVTPSNSDATTVTISLLVAASPVIVGYPGTLTLNYQAGGAIPSSFLYLNSSDNSAIAFTATTSTPWLSVGTPTQPTTNAVLSVQGTNLSSLGNGVYTGAVVVTAAGAANNPVTVPVVLTVSNSTSTGGGLTLGTLATFTSVNGATPPVQYLSVSALTTTYYTASASSTGNWLSVAPSGQYTNSNLAVSVNPSSLPGLTAASYPGVITLTANGVQQTVNVTLVVSGTTGGGSGNVTVTANNAAGTPSLAFTYQVGGSAPASQTLQVVSASGSSAVSFTVSSNAAWLSTGVANGTTLNTPYNNPGFTIGIVNPSGLTATTYNGTITITPNGGTVVNVPVTLTVSAAPTLTVTSTPPSFAYQVGNTDPSPGTIAVSGGGQALGFTAQVTSGNLWLSVSPTSGTTPATGTAALTVTVTPQEANLLANTYVGTIQVSGTGTAAGSTTNVTVTLTVTAPLPTVNSVVNAASFIKGSVSPGEIVTLFGTAIGPATAAYASTDPSTGRLATTIGGVQVLFNGIPAPMIYASNTQVSAIVPYELAPFSTPSVWIKFANQTSNAYSLTSATTVPGIFAQNSQGSGPGAILNQDNSVNGPSNPAAKGSIVQVFMTGEGQTSPQGVTGKITAANLPAPQVTPAPLLAVGVLIDGQPASWTYAGEAPGFAAGLMQLNVQIPATAASGNLSIVVLIGGNSSQNNVTVSVR